MIHRRGREIEENSQRKISPDGSLSIKEIKDEDAGEYECSTHNDFGKDQITYVVTVLGKYYILPFEFGSSIIKHGFNLVWSGPPSSPIIEVATTTSNAIEIQWKPAVSKMSRIKGSFFKD